MRWGDKSIPFGDVCQSVAAHLGRLVLLCIRLAARNVTCGSFEGVVVGNLGLWRLYGTTVVVPLSSAAP